MSEIKITKNNFNEEVLKSNKTVLIDFWATWCGPCQMLSPIITELSQELSDTVKVGKVNVDEEQELAMNFNIASIPTIMIFKNGKVTNTVVGFHSKNEIKNLIER